MRKNIIIDGDKFQKEYKKQYQKEMLTDLIQGIILIIIAGAGILCGSKLLLKLIIYIFPLFVLTYAINLASMGMEIIKKNSGQAITFFVQALVYALFAIYIFINPIETLSIILVVLGILIVINAIVKMIYFPNYLPLGSFIFGGILIIFSEALIDFFYTVVMLFILIYGIGKITKAIYSFKNNDI